MLLPTKKQRFKTKVKEGQDPTYDETFTFSKITPGTDRMTSRCYREFFQSCAEYVERATENQHCICNRSDKTSQVCG